ncbi:response regulator [Croceicoccus naphthovorans]|uniref:response regulator n=1 Tax=Croceicoccus naphthovorans TaxID=1348774 RepID=UPI00069EA2EA|nr:response regulator [Croceicoccus naphthovorans]MBB3990238.1 PleD family two-component response regulator [Croceicoccus naphthovorans]
MNSVTPLHPFDGQQATGPRILIVDDDPDAAQITASLLTAGGSYRITCVESAQAAYNALSLTGGGNREARMECDLVIMDILMPDVDGIEATAAIRTSPRGAFLPILMLSGRRDLDALGQAFMAGASDFVTKPIEPVELQARVRTLLRLKREQDRRQARERQLVTSNRELQEAVLDGTLIDGADGLPSRAWAEMLLRDARMRGTPMAAALIQIEELDAYVALHGVRGAERLAGEIAARLRTVPAPLGVTLAHWDEGRFIVFSPGRNEAERLEKLCVNMQHAVEYPAIPHGNALHHDRVRVSTASAWRPAATVVDLPSALIASLAEENFRGKRHVALA